MVSLDVRLVDFMDARPLPGAVLDLALTITPRFPVNLPEDPGPVLDPRPDARFAEKLREAVVTDADGRASVRFDAADVFARLRVLRREERPRLAVDAVATLSAGATFFDRQFDPRVIAESLTENSTVDYILPVDLGMSIVGHTTPSTTRLWFHLPFEPRDDHSFVCHVIADAVAAPAHLPTIRPALQTLAVALDGQAGAAVLEITDLGRSFSIVFDQPAHTALLDIDDLAPDTTHHYTLTGQSDGRHFILVTGRFRTPAVNQSSLAIAFGSCHLPVLTGTPDDPSAESRRSLELWQRLADRHDFEALLLIGDQIYGDQIDTKWEDTDDWFTLYARRYRQLWAYRPVREVLRTTPTYMILDDHDVKDDFGVVPIEEPGDTRVPGALNTYRAFQHAHNPGGPNGPLHFSFQWGPASFFVADGRTNLGKSPDAPVLGRDQRAAIEAWASSPETLASDIIFFVAPVPFALLPTELIRKVADQFTNEALSVVGFLAGLVLGIPPFPVGMPAIGNAVVLGATGFLAGELFESYVDRTLLLKADLGERWDHERNQADLIWVLDLLFDLANGMLAADRPPRKRSVIILSGDIHAGTMHLIRSLPKGRGIRHAANPLITQITSSAISHTPLDGAVWKDAIAKVDDDIRVHPTPLGLLKLLDGGTFWEGVTDVTSIDEALGKGSGGYFLDPNHDRRYLTQFAGLLLERTVGFVRVQRSDPRRRAYRIELVIEGQTSDPVRSVTDVDLDAPSRPGLKLSAESITFGSVPLGQVETRNLTIENASGASVAISIAAAPSGSPFTWPAFNDVVQHRDRRSITLQFRPAANGIVQSALSVTSNAPGSPQVVALLGKGPGGFPTDPGPALPTKLHVSPSIVTFGSGPLQTIRTRTLTIENATGRAVKVSVAAAPRGPFTWRAFSGVIAHGAKRRIEIQFHATSNAIVHTALTIVSDTSGSPQAITITGKGPGGF